MNDVIQANTRNIISRLLRGWHVNEGLYLIKYRFNSIKKII